MAESQRSSNIWEFRKQDDSDSSDHEPKSSSSAERRPKNINQIPQFYPNKYQQAADIHHRHHLMNRPVKKENRMQLMNHGVKVDRSNARKMKDPGKDGKKKNSRRKHEPATIGSNLILMQSILEELRVEGEHLLEWMRGEVKKMMDDANTENAAGEGFSKWKIKIKFRHDQ